MSTWNEQIDELSRMIQEEEEAFREPIESRERKAREMLAAGVKPGVSSAIDESLTYGYGFLDQFGFWQYPLEEDEIPESMRVEDRHD